MRPDSDIFRPEYKDFEGNGLKFASGKWLKLMCKPA